MALTSAGALICDEIEKMAIRRTDRHITDNNRNMFQLLQAMFSSIADTWRGPTMDVRAVISEAHDREKSISSTPLANDGSDPYAGEIHRLMDALNGGRPFEKGSCIDISLQDILHIIPKRRRRVDAFRGLQRALSERQGVTLRIKSNKTKQL